MIQEDEISLQTLFKILWSKKVFILFFTLFVTFLSIIYVFNKTPIYEVKSVIRVGHIGDVLIEEGNILEKKLRVIFNVDEKDNFIKEKEAIVSNIKVIRELGSLLEISTQAFSNEKAVVKNKEVLSFIQKEYQNKIDDFLESTKLNIDSLTQKIKYINNVSKIKVNEEIKFLKEIELPSIENKLKLNEERLKEYQENIINLSKRRVKGDTNNVLFAMEMLNNQNLILNLQNQIENLNKAKLELVNKKINKLKIKRDIELDYKIEEINKKIEEQKLKLKNTNLSNSERIGDLIIQKNPVKPNKKIIIVVSFFIGIILSIFLVLFMQFIKFFKEEKNDK